MCAFFVRDEVDIKQKFKTKGNNPRVRTGTDTNSRPGARLSVPLPERGSVNAPATRLQTTLQCAIWVCISTNPHGKLRTV